MSKSKYKIEFDPLDPDSIQKVIDYINDQWIDRLKDFGERVAERLAEEGYQVAMGIIASHTSSGDTLDSLYVRHDGDGIYTIYANSSGLLFLEFGSGVVGQAGIQNPWAGENGYGPGTYPGQTNALNPDGWVYPTGYVRTNKNGGTSMIYARTKGQTAKRPFYTAYKDMEQHIQQIINEEFDPDDFA